jgi:hypothetical protein
VLAELLIATAMVVLTVILHGWGLAWLARLLRVEALDSQASGRLSLVSARAVGFTIAAVLGLFVLHGVEIWLYALLYNGLGAIPDFRIAVFYSTATYAAIGYGENEIAESWRLLGSIEGINGVVLLGWSTAFFIRVITRFRL